MPGMLTLCPTAGAIGHWGLACRYRPLTILAALVLAVLLLGSPAVLLAAIEVAQGVEGALVASTIVAPELTATDYPTIAGVNGRVTVWLVAQLHL